MLVDKWIIHGFEGLLNLMKQRMHDPRTIDPKIVEKYLEYQKQYNDICYAVALKKGDNEEDNSTFLIDQWLLKGLSGIIDMIQKRDLKTVDARTYKGFVCEIQRLKNEQNL